HRTRLVPAAAAGALSGVRRCASKGGAPAGDARVADAAGGRRDYWPSGAVGQARGYPPGALPQAGTGIEGDKPGLVPVDVGLWVRCNLVSAAAVLTPARRCLCVRTKGHDDRVRDEPSERQG